MFDLFLQAHILHGKSMKSGVYTDFTENYRTVVMENMLVLVEV
jgi:hypothetical protein